MMKFRKRLRISAGLLAAFVLWTLAVCLVDVQAIGPHDSTVGFAKINLFVHNLTGTNLVLYTITDWLGLAPIGTCLCFALLGLAQCFKRKSIGKVDFSLLVLGGFYIAVMAVYAFFEVFVVNYRPVLIDGFLEASYPSSTTLLVMCVMPTTLLQLKVRIRNNRLRSCAALLISAYTAFMVIGRLLSGVHWFSDIVGGVLLSAGLVMLYAAVSNLDKNARKAFKHQS